MLSGGTAFLQPYFVRAQVPGLSPTPATTWVTFPDLYRARCASTGNASWLQVDHESGTGRPVVAVTADPAFGYHANDMTLALGDLVADVAASEAAYTSPHG